MNNFISQNTKVIIGFPEVTEIRIGSALRIATSLYLKFNSEFSSILGGLGIEEEKLKDLLRDLKNVYKFKLASVYFQYAFKKLVGDTGIKLDIIKFEGLKNINAELGLEIIPIKFLNFLNDIVLKRLLDIYFKNLNEDELEAYALVIKYSEYYDIYSSFCDSEKELIEQCTKDMFAWFHYHQIIVVKQVYVDKNTKDIIIPVKFSFIERLKNSDDEFMEE